MEKTTEWRPGAPLPTVCRCCLADGCYKDISTEYFWMGSREVYSEMLSSTFDIQISYSQAGGPNSHSRLICEACITRLRDAYDFKKQVLECEKTFMQHLDPGRLENTAEIELELISPIEKAEEVKVEEVKQESNDDDFDDIHDFPAADDDDDDDLDDEPLTKLASRMPKKESMDILDLIDNKVASTSKRKATIKLKTSPSKKSKTKEKGKVKLKDSTKSKSKSATKDIVKAEKKKKGSVALIKWNDRRERTFKSKYNDQRGNAVIILECSNVCPFRWKPGSFTCAFCSLTFGDLKELREHTVIHTNKIEAARFIKSIDLLKVEVSDLRCELCFSSMKDIETLAEHLIEIHDKPIKKEYGVGVSPFLIRGKENICTFCNVSFEVFSKLNMHTNEHYPNCVCFECGKSFSHESRLKAHLLIHSSGTFSCPKCNLDFSTRVLKNNHMAQVHGPIYKYKCPYCRQCFKCYPDRSKHLVEFHDKKIEYPCHLCSAVFLLCHQRTRHINQVHIKIKNFTCNICGDKFVSDAQLRNHIVKHTGERTFQCEFCNKAYARRKTLREHLRIHYNDKRFPCEYCNSAFIQKCSLKNHIKTHHPHAIKKEY